jgi:hypothetical protein
MPPVVRIALMSSLMVIRTLFWIACSLLIALSIFVSFTLPPVANEGLSGRIARTWDGSIAWLNLKIFDQQYLATEAVALIVDPNCTTALGHADYQAIVNCGKKCANYPRPACGPRRRRSPHRLNHRSTRR